MRKHSAYCFENREQFDRYIEYIKKFDFEVNESGDIFRIGITTPMGSPIQLGEVVNKKRYVPDILIYTAVIESNAKDPFIVRSLENIAFLDVMTQAFN
jgi:hypothetical protein